MRTGVSLAAIAVSLALVGGAIAAGSVSFMNETFSKPSKMWPTGTYSYGKVAFHAGKLRTTVKSDNTLWEVPQKYWGDLKSETVTVDANLVSGNHVNNMGVQCVYDAGDYYNVVIGSDGDYGVVRMRTGKGTLLWKENNKKVIHPTAVNHIRADCTSAGRIALTVNGTRLFSTVDKHPIGTFSEAGLFIGAHPGGPATIDFDNFKVTGTYAK